MCDIGYVIQDHITALMQLLTNEPALRDYNMNVITTKCLNTAIIMWYLFLGEGEDGKMNDVRFCDSRETRKRGRNALQQLKDSPEYERDDNNPLRVIDRLEAELMDRTPKGCNKRTIFYVMMTDTDMPYVKHLYHDDSRTDQASSPAQNISTTNLRIPQNTFLDKDKPSTITMPPSKEPQVIVGGGNRGRKKASTSLSSSRLSAARAQKGGGEAVLTGTIPVAGENEKPSSPKVTQFFPGHVYVIEKVESSAMGDEDGKSVRLPRYNLFQSYIDHYTLNGHIRTNKSLALSYDKMKRIARGLRELYSVPYWTPENTRFWKELTHVDVHDLEGCQFKDKSFMCFRKADTTNCVGHLREYLQAKYDELEARVRELKEKAAEDRSYVPEIQRFMRDVYGDRDLYHKADTKVMSNEEMKAEIYAMLTKM